MRPKDSTALDYIFRTYSWIDSLTDIEFDLFILEQEGKATEKDRLDNKKALEKEIGRYFDMVVCW